MRWIGITFGLMIPSISPGQSIDFVKDIKPILARHCLPCHGADEKTREAGLRLDTFESASADREGTRAIVPGKPESSELIRRVTSRDADLRMPPAKLGNSLEPREVNALKKWIAAGAEYTPHWAFIPPKRPPHPKVSHHHRLRNPIDGFVLARLEQAGLSFSPDADRATLIRRLSLDLIGLPPTPEQVRMFVEDTSADAYEKLVDRLLAHPGYGERWARVWLDLARYADSAGYGSDPLRTIWRYRDWTIEAFNANMPYDQFTICQLAGDLLPNRTDSDLLATAFHRNTMTNTEGGTDDEEFRIAAVKDRVDVTFQVWMGITAGCAKCHSHKYDPLLQEEYYRLFAIFNQTEDNDQPSEAPVTASPTGAMKNEQKRIDSEIAHWQQVLETPTPELAHRQAEWENNVRPSKSWIPIRPETIAMSDRSPFALESDGTVRIQGPAGRTAQYTLTFSTGAEPVSAVRLDTLPHPQNPAGGAGRGPDGNFVVSEIVLETASGSTTNTRHSGRFVRIDLPGLNRILQLAEVQVFSNGVNIARNGTARQSSTDYEGVANRAIDGESNGDFYAKNSVTHTKQEKNPWWEVDLGDVHTIDRIVVWNRTDGDTWKRLNGYRVSLLDGDRKSVWSAEPKRISKNQAGFTPSTWSEVAISSVTTDFEQPGFRAQDVLDKKPNTGWATAPKIEAPHWLNLGLSQPIPPDRTVRVTIECRHQANRFALGRFRVSVNRDPRWTELAKLPAPVQLAMSIPVSDRTPADANAVAKYFQKNVAGKPYLEKIELLKKSRPIAPTVPVMRELPPDRRRKTHILEKGNFLMPGKEVTAGLPSAFHSINRQGPVDRLYLAHWLVSADNPLTARVAVNRYWSRLFGRGLVETEEDFGTQGELPTHPELLDWLATEYIRLKWDTKALLKTIVMSTTYRQTSKTLPIHWEKDPANRLLARFPRQRLEAELVRDQALALAGLLTEKVGGESIFPPQPEGLWQAAFNGQRTWATSKGEDRYRRGLYVFWRRTVPYPSMAAFDAPSRETCTLRRKNTNTPLQAFVTLNDPVYVEAAQALARRILSHPSKDVSSRARFGLELCLGCTPTETHIKAIVELTEKAKREFAADPKRAVTFASEPLGPLPKHLDPAETAAWTLVANVLLNLDAVLTKG